MKKKMLFIILIGAMAASFFLFTKKGQNAKGVIATYLAPTSLVNDTGKTIQERIKLPDGARRETSAAGSFSNYIQRYALKPAGSKVINYNGAPYVYQAGHIGILKVPVPDNGLQQCADALIRIRAEYLWDNDRQDEIGFEFTSGHYCSWLKYAQGYRPKINGNKVSFYKTATANSSKENFYNYLNLIFTYAGTYSLSQELTKVQSVENSAVGDLLIYPGFPGHVIMIADMMIDSQGKRHVAFLQGNTPAQSIHLIKNPNNLAMSPWYDLEGKTELQIPTYTFEKFEIMRFK